MKSSIYNNNSLAIFILFFCITTFVLSNSIHTQVEVSSSLSISPIPRKNELISKSVLKNKLQKLMHEKVLKEEEKTPNKTETNNFKTRISDFFHKTSKSNQNVAMKALSAFVCGIILFICSIHLICWNERRAVKETQFIDYVRDEKKCKQIDNGVDLQEAKGSNSDQTPNENKVYIVNGPVTVEEEAILPELNIPVQTNKGKITTIQIQFEKFGKRQMHEERNLGENENGDQVVEVNDYEKKYWYDANYQNNRFTTKFYHGKVSINNKYTFPKHHLETQLTMCCNVKDLADNSYIYRPKQEDIAKLEEYFKSKNNSEIPFKFFIHNQFIYILRNYSNKNTDNFNPDLYDFSESDLRMCIKYFYVNSDNFVTACGKIEKKEEKYEISSYKTSIKKPGCSYWCCCCAESAEYYTVDLVYFKKMQREEIVTELENLNDACTWLWRLLGFLLHFASYYLMLYPLILLVGMIPFIGAIGATVLIFIAFIMSLITFLFIIACAWICARPVLAVLIFGVIIVLILVGKQTSDHIKQQNNQDGNQLITKEFLK